MNQKLLSFAIAIICGSQIANAWSWVSSYAYCNGIPNILVDPDGRIRFMILMVISLELTIWDYKEDTM